MRRIRYPARSCNVSSVASTRPEFLMRFSLSSIRIFIPATALAFENIFSGSRAEFPYLSFLSSNKSSICLHLDFILFLVFIDR